MAYKFFAKRQTMTGSGGGSGDYGDYGTYGRLNSTQVYDAWFSTNGVGARYGTTAAIIVVIILALLFSYLHGIKRLHEGLPLLFYHRWMFNTRRPNSINYWGNLNRQGAGSHPPDDSGYAMDPWHHPSVPPPAYHENVPPAYQPPPGASKVAPNQTLCEVNENVASNNDNDNRAASLSPAPHSPIITTPAPSHLR